MVKILLQQHLFWGAAVFYREKWFDKNGPLIVHYKHVYDGQGNIVRSIDILKKIEYNYEYEEGRIVRATESDIVLSEGIVVSKSVVNTVKYYYDAEGKITKKVITPANDSAQTIYYETNDDNTVVKFSAGGRTVTSHSKTDSFGRKIFDELQLGTGFVSRQFHYYTGEVTEEHKANEKLKSSATTQLVSQIILSDGRTISYEYDAEEHITRISDSVDGVTEYTYDSLGQLLTETVNGELVNVMTYDNYGNILTKNGVVYTYSNTTWKDLLTSYNGQEITYDAQGNPTSYLGHALTWEKGRQLKSFDNISYTYNANGIRTSKTVDGVTHIYNLDGSKILSESWDNNTLIPLYDNEQIVCGIIYNSVPYYFQKNLQGDIVGIVNKDSEVVAKYSYDAWGACTIKQDISEIGIATINPFRYRGYYYDCEIEMYYLQSRYYNSKLGRFINMDDIRYLGIGCTVTSYNISTYCENNPIYSLDPDGHLVVSAGISLGCAIVAGMNFIATFLIDGKGNFGLLLGVTLLYGIGLNAILSSPSSPYSWSFGIYWKYSTIEEYLIATAFTISAGAGNSIGLAFDYPYYHYRNAKERKKYNKKRLVGVQISNGSGIYYESQIVLSDGRTISYEYDEEERITKVIDSVDGTTEYTYDALGQLLTETVNGEVVNSTDINGIVKAQYSYDAFLILFQNSIIIKRCEFFDRTVF